MFNKSDIKNVIYLGLGFVIFRNIAELITGITDKLTPDKPSEEERKIVEEKKSTDAGKVPVTKKGKGENLNRIDTDTYLSQRVAKLKEGIESNNQSMIQNALIPVKTDADFARMSELFGEEFSLLFTRGAIGKYNMSEAIQTFASAYSKARVNQSWSNNKKYPKYITFKL